MIFSDLPHELGHEVTLLTVTLASIMSDPIAAFYLSIRSQPVRRTGARLPMARISFDVEVVARCAWNEIRLTASGQIFGYADVPRLMTEMMSYPDDHQHFVSTHLEPLLTGGVQCPIIPDKPPLVAATPCVHRSGHPTQAAARTGCSQAGRRKWILKPPGRSGCFSLTRR